jgi:hypothetical protein
MADRILADFERVYAQLGLLLVYDYVTGYVVDPLTAETVNVRPQDGRAAHRREYGNDQCGDSHLPHSLIRRRVSWLLTEPRR